MDGIDKGASLGEDGPEEKKVDLIEIEERESLTGFELPKEKGEGIIDGKGIIDREEVGDDAGDVVVDDDGDRVGVREMSEEDSTPTKEPVEEEESAANAETRRRITLAVTTEAFVEDTLSSTTVERGSPVLAHVRPTIFRFLFFCCFSVVVRLSTRVEDGTLSHPYQKHPLVNFVFRQPHRKNKKTPLSCPKPIFRRYYLASDFFLCIFVVIVFVTIL